MKVVNTDKISNQIDILFDLFMDTDDIELAHAYASNINRLNNIYIELYGIPCVTEDMAFYLECSSKGEEVENLHEFAYEQAVDYHNQGSFLQDILPEIISPSSSIMKENRKSNIQFFARLDEIEKMELLKEFYKEIECEQSLEFLEQLKKSGNTYKTKTIGICNVSFPSYKSQKPIMMLTERKNSILQLADIVYDLGMLEDYQSFIDNDQFLELHKYNVYDIYQLVLPRVRYKQFLNFVKEKGLYPDLVNNTFQKIGMETYDTYCQTHNRTFIPTDILMEMYYSSLSDRKYRDIKEFNEQLYGWNPYSKQEYQEVDFMESITYTTSELLSDTMVYHDQAGIRSVNESLEILESLKLNSTIEQASTKLGVTTDTSLKLLKQNLKSI